MHFSAILLLLPLVLASSGGPRNVVPWVGGYEFIYDLATWTEADSRCASLGGQLAQPQTAAEGAALQQLLGEHGAAQAHVGFHDLFVEGEYVTVLGQSLAQTGYQAGELLDDDAADCGSLAADGLRSIPCSLQLPAICQLAPGADYDLLAGFGYYKRHTEYKTWSEASQACRQEGADLLVLRSDEEYTAVIVKYLNMTTGYWVHYGGHHAFEDQRFVSIFGEPLNATGFATWGAGEPRDSNVDKPYLGVTIPEKGRDRGLALFEDTFARSFICKRDLYT